MSRLAAHSVEDKYEVHGGDPNQPKIVVTPAKNSEPEVAVLSGILSPTKGSIPHTPRPPKREIGTAEEE